MSPSPGLALGGGPVSETLVVAHRGASRGMVDNSPEAFEKAIELGADMIEFDVHRTRTGELIVFHDDHAGGRPVGELTGAEIGDAIGHTPPTLTRVFEIARGRIGLDVELKEGGYVDRVLAQLTERFEPEEVVVTSFLDDVVAECKRLAPQLRAGLLVGLARPRPYLRTRFSELDPITRLQACGADFLAPHTALARLGAVERVTKAGYPAFVWTINDEAAMRRLFAGRHVAALITDVPGRALELRAEVAG
jgi:glycerophosphoryl diester phosphodiesterase